MWSNYFLQIKKKYSMQVSSKEPLVINLDGKNVTGNSKINIIEIYKGSFRDILEQSARYFSKKYTCFAIFGADEISFIFEEPMKLIDDLNSDRNTFSTEIVSVFSQYFFDYFNSNLNNTDKIFWHGKCFSIHLNKINSFIKYKSRLMQVLTTTYFLKHKGIPNAGIIKLDKKIEMCETYNDYVQQRDSQKGTLYYSGKKIDIEKYLNGSIVEIDNEENNFSNDHIITQNVKLDDTMFDDILNL